jgi:L-fuconolactonase
MLITDAQVHLWVAKPGQSAPAGSGTEQHPEGHPPEALVAEMAEAGVNRAVIVPPGALCSNEEAQGFCRSYPGRFALMGVIDPEVSGIGEQLPVWLSRPYMLGARLSFSSGGVFKPSFDDGTVDWFWSDAERYQIPLMILVGGMAARTYAIAERHPDLKLIIDHMARPSRAAGSDSWTDLDDLLRLAKLPNVYVKLSSAPNYSSEPYPYADIHPHLRRLYEAFGPRRLMWGTDLTRLRGTYRECLLLFQEALTFLSADDREWILGKTVAATLDWPED